jgi:[glutamine synthetase] adenylyltransferase / [glutamine synthetase]-adenylyl-L-tyrosine phosphorylase
MTNQFSKAIEQAASASSYLSRLIAQSGAWLEEIAQQSTDQSLANCRALCEQAAVMVDEDSCKRTMREAKNKCAVLIALLEISGTCSTEQCCKALTDFADAAVKAAVSFALLALHRNGKLQVADPGSPQDGCGYTVLAMGKHGAGELNYSSDIDLIVLYDAQANVVPEGADSSGLYVRLTRLVVNLLQDITEDGYVFRTDLRLRPDPRATQVAIAIEAAAIYYENQGQNWERAAMIKARVVAGDRHLGEEFLQRLQPYIWRKYLDFAAVADIQSLKRQIHAVKGHGEIAIRGHNLKLGRGGIREIELFVQTQQLIAGGRNRALRGKRTVDVLDALADADWISPLAAQELKDAYWQLRKLEHAVQMREDQQDHCVPVADAAYSDFAKLAGFASGEGCAVAIRKTLECVVRHSQALFHESDALSSDQGSLVFTGGEDDPDTINTLSSMGFHQASEVAATIRGWHFGRYNATRSKLARELLTELMPSLLQGLARTGDADHAFIAFDKFLSGLPAGVQLFSMLKANPHLLDLLCRTMGTAPRLAQSLSRMPRTLEAVLDPNFFGPLPTLAELRELLASQIQGLSSIEDVMNQVRVFAREQMFRVGVRILSETVKAEEAGQGHSNIADVAIESLHTWITAEMQTLHGPIAGGESAVLALGKWGGREMTATSDLDLMIIYRFADDSVSLGPKPLSGSQYFARLTQKLVTAITSPTAEGVLFDVDMRLRPSGSKGPVAVSISSFESYQQGEAWTWERMALTRARVVSAPPTMEQRVQEACRNALTAERDASTTLVDICQMRRLMLKEQGPTGVWDLKRKRGGLVEIEFIAQALELVNCHAKPNVLKTNTRDALDALWQSGVLTTPQATVLRDAWVLYSQLMQILRLAVEGETGLKNAPAGLRQLLETAAACPSLVQTEALLADFSLQVIEIFDEIICCPDDRK